MDSTISLRVPVADMQKTLIEATNGIHTSLGAMNALLQEHTHSKSAAQKWSQHLENLESNTQLIDDLYTKVKDEVAVEYPKGALGLPTKTLMTRMLWVTGVVTSIAGLGLVAYNLKQDPSASWTGFILLSLNTLSAQGKNYQTNTQVAQVKSDKALYAKKAILDTQKAIVASAITYSQGIDVKNPLFSSDTLSTINPLFSDEEVIEEDELKRPSTLSEMDHSSKERQATITPTPVFSDFSAKFHPLLNAELSTANMQEEPIPIPNPLLSTSNIPPGQLNDFLTALVQNAAILEKAYTSLTDQIAAKHPTTCGIQTKTLASYGWWTIEAGFGVAGFGTLGATFQQETSNATNPAAKWVGLSLLGISFIVSQAQGVTAKRQVSQLKSVTTLRAIRQQLRIEKETATQATKAMKSYTKVMVKATGAAHQDTDVTDRERTKVAQKIAQFPRPLHVILDPHSLEKKLVDTLKASTLLPKTLPKIPSEDIMQRI